LSSWTAYFRLRLQLDGRLAQVQRRMDQAYQGKLDGKISEEFWMRKSAEWQTEETQIRASKQALVVHRPERLLDAARILELANKAYFLYVKQTDVEKARLLKMVLSNCAIEAVSLYPTHRKPFDLIFQAAKTEKWRTQGDDFRTFLAEFVAILPQIDLPAGLGL
jgi:site-specific DNA recombinase